ncbi:hypothetical protein [Flagellimonas sp.]|uniref:hypothetical protein n=1 Tax=Flagellimonas sp. TaxID=2058762 RepID=UPI003BACE7E6
MAATPGELARIQNLENQFAAFLVGTIAVDSMTGTQRKTVENSLYPILNGYRNRKGASNTNYAAWEAGDEVMNIDNSAKQLVIGRVLSTPFDPTTDLDDRAKFDWYVDAKPKL